MPRHHWVPQALLANFTLSGTQRDQLCRFSMRTESFDTVRTRDVCYVDDLHTLDQQSIQRALSRGLVAGPDTFEKLIARDVERKALAAIRTVATHSQPLSPDDFTWLVSYVAFQVVRTPYYLGLVQERTGSRRPNEVLALALGDQPEFFSRLADRRWSLWKVRRDKGYFWISDNPVSVSAESGRPLDMSLDNLDRRDSVVHLPLTKRLVLVGGYSGKHAFTYDVHDSTFVGFLNRLSLLSTGLEIFGPSRPLILQRNGELTSFDGIEPGASG